MNESYAEWLVKRKVPFYAYILNTVLGVITVICTVLAFTTGVLAVVLMFVSGFLTYLSYRNTRVEFEYLYVGDQLSIDRILGKAKRKKAFECSMGEIQIIAPSDSNALNDYRTDAKTLDFSSGEAGARIYTAIVQHSGEMIKLIFEPNDKLLKCFRQSAPRKVIQ